MFFEKAKHLCWHTKNGQSIYFLMGIETPGFYLLIWVQTNEKENK
jgi:hypothetical protein